MHTNLKFSDEIFLKKISTLTIPFPSSRLANIAERALNVDKELKSDQVKRIITTDDDKLIVYVLIF